jgi:hypothetical protein
MIFKKIYVVVLGKKNKIIMEKEVKIIRREIFKGYVSTVTKAITRIYWDLGTTNLKFFCVKLTSPFFQTVNTNYFTRL